MLLRVSFMKLAYRFFIAIIAATASWTALAADKASANRGSAAHPKGQYAALDKLPDWGGIWVLKINRDAVRERPALKGRYLEQHQAFVRAEEANKGNMARGASNCLPPGVPGIMGTAQYPTEFLFTPGRVTMLHEAWMQWRIVFTDGRGHAEDMEASFNGDSIGHWEGDTLVIETVGIKPSVELTRGMRHSEQLRIVERIHLAKDDPDTLINEMTAEDPLALEKPWRNVTQYRRMREGTLIEFICAENDRNPVDESGRSKFE